MLEVTYFITQPIDVLDCFDGRELMLIDPVHKLPRTLFFIRNLLDFEIEESSLSILDCFLELLPIF